MRRGAIAGTLGLLVTLLAAGVVFAPETLRAIGPVDTAIETIDAQDPRSLLLGVGFLASLSALVVSRASASTTGRGPGPIVDDPPEGVTAERGTTPGSAVDGRVERAADDGDADPVRASLRASAVRTLARDPEVSTEAASQAVESGTWTDDPLASAFLRERPAPLRARLRAWLDPGREHRRRVERTVEAIEDASDGGRQ